MKKCADHDTNIKKRGRPRKGGNQMAEQLNATPNENYINNSDRKIVLFLNVSCDRETSAEDCAVFQQNKGLNGDSDENGNSSTQETRTAIATETPPEGMRIPNEAHYTNPQRICGTSGALRTSFACCETKTIHFDDDSDDESVSSSKEQYNTECRSATPTKSEQNAIQSNTEQLKKSTRRCNNGTSVVKYHEKQNLSDWIINGDQNSIADGADDTSQCNATKTCDEMLLDNENKNKILLGEIVKRDNIIATLRKNVAQCNEQTNSKRDIRKNIFGTSKVSRQCHNVSQFKQLNKIIFVDHNTDERIEQQKTNIKCWWCDEYFDTLPIYIPTGHYVNNVYTVIGTFCSFDCAGKYNSVMLNDWQCLTRLAMLNVIKSNLLDDQTPIKFAISRELLKSKGGLLDKNDFRKYSTTLSLN